MSQHRGLRLTNNVEPYCKSLIREMESHGWTGRFTSNSHILMMAPDGVTTCSVSPRVGAEHRRHNLGREFRAWLRDQEAAAAVATQPQIHEAPAIIEPEPEPVPAPEAPVDTPEQVVSQFRCDDCGRGFGGAQPLSVHRVRAHVRVPCPVCDQPFSPGNLPRHQRRHAEEFGAPEQMMREIYQARAEIGRLRAEVGVWQHLAEVAEAETASLRSGLRALLDG